MSNNGKILITGGKSMIAQAFASRYPDEVVCAGKEELDITKPSMIRTFLESGRFHTVINTAGVSSKSSYDMYGINARYPYRIAMECAKTDVRFVLLSSTRVFNGNKQTPYLETDEPDPIDDYGQSKFLGELLVQSLSFHVPYYIFRLPLVLGGRDRNRDAQVVTRLIDQARQGKAVKAADDVFHSPVHVSQAVSAMMDCIGSGMPKGIYHLGRGESISLYDLMTTVINSLGMESDIIPVKSSDLDYHRFPRYQSLSSTVLTVGSSLSADMDLFVSEEKGE